MPEIHSLTSSPLNQTVVPLPNVIVKDKNIRNKSHIIIISAICGAIIILAAGALFLFKPAAGSADPVYEYERGRQYYNGQGVTKDYHKAVNYYRKASGLGNAQAQFELAECYSNGKGVTNDQTEAVKWYRKAAELGNAQGQYGLGMCYTDGKGVIKDQIEAELWFRKAAEQGYQNAQYCLAVINDKGDGVMPDKVEAVKWYRKAAEQGNVQAQVSLGVHYYTGEGVIKDESEAVTWLEKSANQTNAIAQYILGDCYFGVYKIRNRAKAVEHFRNAANQGLADAQYRLGLCYELGEGVGEDKTIAMGLYNKAAVQGHEDAKGKIRVEKLRIEAAEAPKSEARSGDSVLVTPSFITWDIFFGSLKAKQNMTLNKIFSESLRSLTARMHGIDKTGQTIYMTPDYISVWAEAQLALKGQPIEITRYDTMPGRNRVTIFSVSQNDIIRIRVAGECPLSSNNKSQAVSSIESTLGQAFYICDAATIVYNSEIKRALKGSLDDLISNPSRDILKIHKYGNLYLVYVMKYFPDSYSGAKISYRINIMSHDLGSTYAPELNKWSW